MQVVKRNGKCVDYSVDKIVKAISSANNGDLKDPLLSRVIKHFNYDDMVLYCNYKEQENISVEEIQDMVEELLMAEGHFDLAKKYIIYREKHSQSRILKDKIDYMDMYSNNSSSSPAKLSNTDANANMSQRNVATSEIEVYKDINRQIQRLRMKTKLDEMFPDEGLGKTYINDVEHHIIYPHDEASSPEKKYYCKAVTLYPLAENGTSTLDGTQNSAPKNLNSFCGQFVNTIFNLSSQCKGAVGVGEFFNYFDYYCTKDFGPKYHLLSDNYADSEIIVNRKTIGEKIDQAFQQIVYNINQTSYGRGQSPFTNFNVFDSFYWKSLFEHAQFPDGTKPIWERVDWLQRRFMKWLNKERTKVMLTFPVVSVALLNDGNKVLDESYEDFVAEQWSEGDSFFCLTLDNPEAISSCCRLRNNITENTFSSINGLTGVQTGSCNVITLNLNRIIQDFVRSNKNFKYTKSSKELLLNYLGNILERVYRYHIAYKTMLYEHESKGMFSSCNAGYISIQKLYSTIGINGFNEAAEFLGFECTNNDAYKSFCVDICGFIDEQNKLHSTKKFTYNLEFVPAESLGVKNYNWDKEDGYVVNEFRHLYNAYFYLADDENTTVYDKFIMHGGKLSDVLSGGQAVHVNLEDHLTKDQYKNHIRFNVKNKCSYWTYNIVNTECLDCHHIEKLPHSVCPKCGSSNLQHWTRPVGFIRPIEMFGEGRLQEANERYYTKAKDA